MNPDLSVLIPAKDEPYLLKTIEDIVEHAKGSIEILVGLDGKPKEPEVILKLLNTPQVRLIYPDEPIGQRALINEMAYAAYGKYLMKTDAHCSFGHGFDVKMLQDMDDRTIMAPYMMILDADTWTVRPDKKTSAYVFDTQLVMQYGQENKEIINETMCLQGSCFMVSRDTFFLWEPCDEDIGSWGGQGVELGIAAFLNGGRCVTNKGTYYGHLFRHADNEFPYERNRDEITRGQQTLIKKLKTKSIAGLIEKYNYPCDWTREKVEVLPEENHV